MFIFCSSFCSWLGQVFDKYSCAELVEINNMLLSEAILFSNSKKNKKFDTIFKHLYDVFLIK